MHQSPVEWFLLKVQKSPEFLREHFIPAFYAIRERAALERDRAIRKDDIQSIKYRQGWLDGVQELNSLFEVLQAQEKKERGGTASMSRILSFFG